MISCSIAAPHGVLRRPCGFIVFFCHKKGVFPVVHNAFKFFSQLMRRMFCPHSRGKPGRVFCVLLRGFIYYGYLSVSIVNNKSEIQIHVKAKVRFRCRGLRPCGKSLKKEGNIGSAFLKVTGRCFCCARRNIFCSPFIVSNISYFLKKY